MTAIRRLASTSAMVLVLLAACSAPDVTAPAEDDHVRGPSSAKVTLIEYGDYQCPPCSNVSRAVDRLLAEHPRDMRFIYRHFPTRLHRNAVPVAKAAEAAEAQGKFWEMNATLFANQQQWYGVSAPAETFVTYARQLHLDEARFRLSMKSDQLERRIRNSHEHGRQVGVRGAPAFFLNGERLLRAPLTYEDLQRQLATAFAEQRGQKR